MPKPIPKSKVVKAERSEGSRDTRRRFEQWASNPTCNANTVSAVHNVRMDKVARRAGVTPTSGASPFALFRGNQFEANLLKNDAERLIPELVSTGVVPENAEGMVDLRIAMNAGSDKSLQTLDQAVDRTTELLIKIGSARGKEITKLPSVIAAAAVRLPGAAMLPEALLIIDVLGVRKAEGTDRAEIVVGEIKTYPDRGGHTDTKQLAQARAQMGLYLHALRTVIAEFDEAEQPVLSDQGFLVLSRPGSDFPRVRSGEDLLYQEARARRGFSLLEEVASALPPSSGPDSDNSENRLDAVLHATTNYCEACISFCDLAERCHDLAIASSDPVILGDAVARFVGGLPLERVGELLDGAAPSNEAEIDLANRMRAAVDPGWD